MNLEDILSGLVALLVLLLVLATLSVSDETSVEFTDEEYDLGFECCPKGTDLSVDADDILDCIYEGKHNVEMPYGLISSSVPFAVKVYCNTGEILEY